MVNPPKAITLSTDPMVSEKQASLASIICRMADLAPSDAGESLNLLVDVLSDTVQADAVAIIKAGPAQDTVQIIAHNGFKRVPEGDAQALDAPRLIREANRLGDESVVLLSGPFSDDPFLLGEGVSSLLMVKKDMEGEVLGTMAVRRDDRSFDDSDIERFSAAAHFVNLSGLCWHLKGDLRSRRGLDPLTGFILYTGFHEVLSREISRARRGERSVSLGLLEMQGWEKYREERGPEVADRVLKFIAHFLRERFRDFDTLARFSPSGFSFVLPDLDVEVGTSVVSRVTGELIEHLSKDPDAAALLPRTALASYPQNATTTERLVEIAEAALLKAVEGRLPDVVVWEEE